MVVPLSPPADVTPGGTTGWQTVSVTSDVGTDAGNVAGVILNIHNTSGDAQWGVRHPSSSFTTTSRILGGTQTFVAAPTNGSDEYEGYRSSAATTWYLRGYILDGNGSFLTTPSTYNVGAASTWEDLDISGDTGTDTALCAFWLIDSSSLGTNETFGLRQNGSTDTLTGTQYDTILAGGFMSVDGSEIMEAYASDTGLNFHLLGWLTAGYTPITNSIDHSAASTGSWLDEDVSGDIPSGDDGVFLHMNSSGFQAYGLRENGVTTADPYDQSNSDQYAFCVVDGNGIFEQQVGSTGLDTYLFGSSTSSPTPADTAGTTIETTADLTRVTTDDLTIKTDP